MNTDRASHKRILHFIDSGGFYGAENVILNLAQQSLNNECYEPIVGCIVQQENEQVVLFDRAQWLGIKAEKIVINNKRFPLDILKVSQLFKKMKIGLIHSHGYKPSVFGFFISKLIHVPILATCHLWFPSKNPPLKYKLMTRLEVFLYRFFPRIVCVSKEIKEILIKASIKEENMIVIDNGIRISDYEYSGEESIKTLRGRLLIKNDAFVVLNVGRLSEQKAQHNIVIVAEKLVRKGVGILFLIVGEGEQRNNLENSIKQKNLENYVKLLGFRSDIADILKVSDVFFLPSLDEGLPISLLEAMASRVPVVVTGVGAIPALVEHERDGLIVKKNDIDDMCSAILRLKENRDESVKFSRNGYERVKKFNSSEHMYNKYEVIYDFLLSTVNSAT